MTEAERYVEITSLLNKAGTLSAPTSELHRLIGDAVLIAWARASAAAQKEGREIVAGDAPSLVDKHGIHF